GAQIAGPPLVTAGVELPYTAAGDHQVKLIVGHIAAGVAHLDDHLLAGDQLGPWVVGVVFALSGELNAVAAPTVSIGLGDVPVREALRHLIRRLAVAGKGSSALTRTRLISGARNSVAAALLSVELGAVRLAAVPVTR